MAQSVEHTEVRMFNLLDESAIDTAYLNDSSAVLFGTPTYVANMWLTSVIIASSAPPP